MSKNSTKLSLTSSQSFHSTKLGLTLHASESLQSSGTNGLRTKKSNSKVNNLSKEGFKSYLISLPTDQKNEITKNKTKKESKPIKSILKTAAPTKAITNSPRTSTGFRISSHVEKASAKRKQSSALSRSKSPLSVISKGPFRSTSRKSLLRDVAFRNYSDDSNSTSPGSELSLISTKTQRSIISGGSKNSRRRKSGHRGAKRIKKLIAQPMEQEVHLLNLLQSKEGTRVGAQLKRSNLSSDSDSDEAMLEVESHDNESEDPSQDEPAKRSTFLRTFDGMPDINDLSSTTTLETVELPEEEDDFQHIESEDQDNYESETLLSSLEELESFTAVEPSKDLDSLDLLVESEDEHLRDHSLVEESQLESISVIMKNLELKKGDVDFKSTASVASVKPSLPSIDQIEAYLDDLLHQASKLAFKRRMRRDLDTKKLVVELVQLTVQYLDTLERNRSLDQTISEYFIKQKEFAFVKRKDDKPGIQSQRLMKALKVLDFNLKRERDTKLIAETLLVNLRSQAKFETNLGVQKVEHFQAKVRETLLKSTHKRLSFVLNDLFREMNEVRNEVSKSRLKVAAIKHQLASMDIKSQKIQDQSIGVHKYLSNQAADQTLSVKILERNAELNRLKDRVTHDIHTITHLKEKESFLQDRLQELKDKLQSKRLRQKQLRDLRLAEMLKRKRLRKEMDNVRSGCLIPYPKLLRDYDATEDHLWAKQQVIQKLRSEHNRLERKLLQVEAEITATDQRKLSITLGLKI